MIDIDKLIKNALKTKDANAVKTYRNIKSEILKCKTAKNAKPYDEVAEIGILKKMAKNLEDSENVYASYHRPDLASECTAEREVIERLLPSPKPLNFLVLELAQLYPFNPTSEGMKIPKSDMGRIIKYLKEKFPYNDGKEIANLVKTYIV